MATKSKKPAKPAILTVEERKLLRKLLAKAEAVDATPVIETPRMKDGGVKRKGNTKRNFWTDGTHAYLRRKKANPEIVKRTDEKVRKNEYVHVKTSDDVEIYEISDWSPLRRKRLDLTEMSLKAVERAIVRSACDEEFRLYRDACEEYARRILGTDLPDGTKRVMFQTQMAYLERRIMRRGGPSPMRIQQELQSVRKERTGTRIYLPH